MSLVLTWLSHTRKAKHLEAHHSRTLISILCFIKTLFQQNPNLTKWTVKIVPSITDLRYNVISLSKAKNVVRFQEFRYEAVRNNTGFTDFFPWISRKFDHKRWALGITFRGYKRHLEFESFYFFQTKNEGNRDATRQPGRGYNQLPRNVWHCAL